MNNNVTITFYGTRGSTPVSGERYRKYGGNTTCIAMETKDRLLVLDCGTGMQQLQQEYFEKKGCREADIFISHMHWDHVQGIPFFAPFFMKEGRFRLYGEVRKGMSIREQIEAILKSPMFPINADALLADFTYYDLVCRERILLGDIVVDTARTNHPDTCTGYRFELGKSAVCTLVDCERTNEELELLAKNADVLIMDAQYTEEEYSRKENWGHSCYERCYDFAKKCGVKKLVLTHHDPFRTDKALDAMQHEVIKRFPQAVFARDGLQIVL